MPRLAAQIEVGAEPAAGERPRIAEFGVDLAPARAQGETIERFGRGLRAMAEEAARLGQPFELVRISTLCRLI